jgi:hypothetical protein
MTDSATVTNHVVAVYATHNQAEDAITLLDSNGFNMKNLSIIGQNYETKEHPVGFANTGDRIRSWGKFGAFWGSIWGVLFGSAMMFVPGIGFVVLAGWIVAALGGAVVGGGLGMLGAALASIGIPENCVVEYETEIKAGSVLVLAHGTDVEIQEAQESLSTTPASRVSAFCVMPPIGVQPV